MIFYEDKISTRIKELIIAGGATLPVVTFWEAEEEGEVKKDLRSQIAILINPRGYNDQAGYAVNMTGYISIESDSAGVRELVNNYKAVMDVVETWQHAAPGAAVGTLDVEGFRVDDFQIVAGGDCGIDSQTGVYFALINFEIDGSGTS